MRRFDYESVENTMDEENFFAAVEKIAKQFGLTLESDEVYDAMMNATILDGETRLHHEVRNQEALDYIAAGIEGIILERR